jgi:hypothetical protein
MRCARKPHNSHNPRQQKGKQATMSQRGAAIRFVGGAYSGKTGWFDTAKDEHTKCWYWVIIQNDQGKDKHSHVTKESGRVIVNESVPHFIEEAVLQQYPDVKAAINKLVALFAQCGIQGESQVITQIISAKLVAACIRQDMNGSNKATWRTNKWPIEQDKEEDDAVEI